MRKRADIYIYIFIRCMREEKRGGWERKREKGGKRLKPNLLDFRLKIPLVQMITKERLFSIGTLPRNIVFFRRQLDSIV